MLSVGRQVGGNYRCIILYLVDRHCVPTVGDLRVITIVVASMSHRRWVCQVWCPWVSVGEKNCGVSAVPTECVTLCLSLVSNNGTCGWRVSSADHEVRAVLCVFSSHLHYICCEVAVSMRQCSVCGSPYLTLFL
jgi:hypothetical protein